MAHPEEGKGIKKPIIICIAVVVIILLVFGIYKLVLNESEEGNDGATKEEMEATTDYNNKLQEVQAKIDEQEKIIQELNNEMVPLVEERSKLEQQLIELTGAQSTEPEPDTAPRAPENEEDETEGEQPAE